VKRVLKIVGIVAGVCIVLLVAAALIVPRVVDPNRYKDSIAGLVEEHTGRKIRIQGDISLSVFPWLGVRIGAVELGNADGFEAPFFARLERLEVRARILPLLRRQVQADVVTVQGLIVNLERGKDGHTNWEDLTGKDTSEKGAAKSQETPLAAGAVAVGGIDVRDASLNWNDRVSGQVVGVRDLFLKTSAITLADPVELQVGFDADTGDMGLTGRFEGAARIDLDLDGGTFGLQDLVFTADIRGKALPGGGVKVKGSGGAALDTGAQRVRITGLKLEAATETGAPYAAAALVEAEGAGDLAAQTFDVPGLKVKVTFTGKQERITANLGAVVRADIKGGKVAVSDLELQVPECRAGEISVQLSTATSGAAAVDTESKTFLLDGLKLSGTVSGSALPGGALPVVLSSRVQGDWGRQSFSVDPVLLEAVGMKAKAVVASRSTPEGQGLKGTLTVDRFHPRELLARLVKDLPDTADPKVLSEAALSIDFTTSPGSVKVDRLAARLDDTRLTGSGSVDGFAAPKARFDVTVDRIEVDRYLPAGKAPAAAPAAAGAPVAGAAKAAVLPMETLRKLSLEGRLQIGELIASGVKMAGIKVGCSAKDGVLRVAPAVAKLYEGSYAGAVVLDLRGTEPKVTFDEKLSGIRLDRLLKDRGVDSGALALAAPSTVALKGAVTADAPFKLLRVEQLGVEGGVGGRLRLVLQAEGTVVDLNRQTLTADGLKMQLGDLNLAAPTRVSDLSGKPSFTTNLSAPAFNLRSLLDALQKQPLKTTDPAALSVVALSGSVKGSPEAFSVEDIKVRLDDTRLEGTLSVRSQPSAAYAFDLRVDALDVDRYLPPPPKDRKPPPATPGAAATGLPSGPLRSLSLDGKLAAGKIKVAGIRLQDVRLQATGKDGLITLHPLSAGLYGGTYNGNVAIDARGTEPRIALDEKLTDVQVGPLLQDLQGKALLTGLTSASLKVSGVGGDADAISRTLNGNVGFVLKDGTIEGVDILGKICRALSTLGAGSLKKEDIVGGVLQTLTRKAQGAEETSSAESTKFSEMHGSMVFTSGVGVNDDLLVQSPLLRVEGAGKLDLPNRSVDYLATAVLVKSCEGQGGRSFRELANYPIPVRISGPLDRPNVKPDLTAGILKILQGGQQAGESAPSSSDRQDASKEPSPQLQQQEEPKKQVEETVKDTLQKGIQDLFKRK